MERIERRGAHWIRMSNITTTDTDLSRATAALIRLVAMQLPSLVIYICF